MVESTFQCGLVGSFTSPGIAIDTRYKGPTALSVSSERHWQSGVNGIAKVPKQSFPQWDSNPIRTVRSPAQANALTHSATAPSTPSRPPRPQSYSRPDRPLLLFPGANVHSSTKLVVPTSRPSTGTTLLTSRYCPSKNPTLQVQLAVRQLGLHNSFSECYQKRSPAGYDYVVMIQNEPIRCMAL